MTKITIAAVSYLNTIPFIYGIEHAGYDLCADLLLSPPSGCAEAISQNRADIALVPVEAIPSISDVRIITNLCIGASSPVRTVVLVSDCPLNQIETIYLDPHSMTSAKLCRILAIETWRINPYWKIIDRYETLDDPPSRSGFVIIGDKVFEHENKFRYKLDLAQQWQEATSLPFVFAAWIARKNIPQERIDTLSKALEFGVEHIAEAVEKYGYSHREYAIDYLTRNIDFKFDSPKREALELFWKKGAHYDYNIPQAIQ